MKFGGFGLLLLVFVYLLVDPFDLDPRGLIYIISQPLELRVITNMVKYQRPEVAHLSVQIKVVSKIEIGIAVLTSLRVQILKQSLRAPA